MGDDTSTSKRETNIVYGAGLGAAFGAASGAIFESIGIPLGVSIGVALGVAIALVFGKKIIQLFGNPSKDDKKEETD